MERAVVLADGKPRIEPRDLPAEIRQPAAPVDEPGAVLTLEEVERRHILRVLEQMNGNRREAARALDIGENTLWRKLKGYGVLPGRKRSLEEADS